MTAGIITSWRLRKDAMFYRPSVKRDASWEDVRTSSGASATFEETHYFGLNLRNRLLSREFRKDVPREQRPNKLTHMEVGIEIFDGLPLCGDVVLEEVTVPVPRAEGASATPLSHMIGVPAASTSKGEHSLISSLFCLSFVGVADQ